MKDERNKTKTRRNRHDQEFRDPQALTDEQLSAVTGGYIVDRAPYARGEEGYLRYYIVDDKTGRPIAIVDDLASAKGYASSRVCSTVIDLYQYKDIFGDTRSKGWVLRGQ